MTRERPILFSAPMVRALLAGRKTQTRRVVRNVPELMNERNEWCLPLKSPYGVVGDRLWVRETWAWPGEEQVIYRADPEAVALVDRWKSDPNYPQVKWRPPIFMPRQHSRITLRITDVRVERLNDISPEDAAAEGWPGPDAMNTIRRAYPTAWYADLWESINGAGSWDTNPWVWAISFERVNEI